MDQMMKKLMGKNEEDDSMKKEAKLSVLKELRKMASDMMGEDLSSGMKKVTVAAPDKEGLKKGLEKAEDMMDQMSESEEEHMEADEDMEEDCSPEELDAKIARLMEKKKSLMK